MTKFYHDNGKLWMVGALKNGKPEGEWKFYYDTGELWRTGSFNHFGQHGEWKWYYETGECFSVVHYENGKSKTTEDNNECY
jgi:antitoxin component YwqK of YwqJK toxin-antitoxin module